MRKTTATTLMAAAAVAAAGGASAAPAQAGVIGLADNKRQAYTNANLLPLNLRYARISVRYDAYRYSSTKRKFLDVYGDAVRNGYRVLVVFQGSPKGLPTPSRIGAAVKGFSKLKVSGVPTSLRSPREFSVYNEPNLDGYYKRRPAALGEAYVRARRANSKATILGGDLLDVNRRGSTRVDTYARAVERGARRYSRGRVSRVKIWGLHNYTDLNQLKRYNGSATQKLLKAVKGQVWLTETGGVVSRPKKNKTKFAGTGEAHQLRANQLLFSSQYLGRSSLRKRVPRTYIYQGIGGLSGSWDSGLLSGTGERREGSIQLLASKNGRY